jgi:hypothetical protein
MVALITGMVGCGQVTPPPSYNLTTTSTAGGSVTDPGEGTFIYLEGELVNLVAEGEEGYRFVEWTGDVDDIADVNAAATTITMNGDYSITANFEVEDPLHTIVDEGWPILAEAFTDTGEILLSIDTDVVETPQELASTYLEAGYSLDVYSGLLSDLGTEEIATEEIAMIIDSMATQFKATGYALADGDFISVANALSNLAHLFEDLEDPAFETDEPVILEAFQNTIHLLTEQAGITSRISDPSPWLEELGELLDFYDAHTIEELQEFACALLESDDPEERALFGLDDPEMVEILENLSVILTSEEFQDWVSIARLDLSGWLNQASQETFILKTAELGHGLYMLGDGMIVSYPALFGLFTKCKDECTTVCAERNHKIESRASLLRPDIQDLLLNIVSFVKWKWGPITLKALKGLKATLMKDRGVVVWVRFTWEHCEMKRCWKHLWLSKYKAWVKKATDWERYQERQ